MKDVKVNASEGGFSVVPTQDLTERQAREQRMKERKENPPASPTLKDIWDFQQDMADRQSEMYDMLKNTK